MELEEALKEIADPKELKRIGLASSFKGAGYLRDKTRKAVTMNNLDVRGNKYSIMKRIRAKRAKKITKEGGWPSYVTSGNLTGMIESREGRKPHMRRGFPVAGSPSMSRPFLEKARRQHGPEAAQKMVDKGHEEITKYWKKQAALITAASKKK
ncbi:hypothetical protein [Primorskyibacter sp. S87]|uniref:hypothetical protein n=1 Tax=Primorskyibacter sp. S87 TaxID=3415126 RepID=UPI003C7B0AA7